MNRRYLLGWAGESNGTFSKVAQCVRIDRNCWMTLTANETPDHIDMLLIATSP